MNGNDYKNDNNASHGRGFAIFLACFAIYFVINEIVEGIDFLISLFMR